MIQKNYIEARGKKLARVTFTLPSAVWADNIALIGDFNGWDTYSHPLRRTRDGEWTISVDLQIGQSYHFAYLCDGKSRLYDAQADDFSPHNSHNFIISTEPGMGLR